jgi:ABC-type branched-subunit amino acid transport system ATPase component
VRSFQKTNILKSLSVFENVLAGHYLEGAAVAAGAPSSRA